MHHLLIRELVKSHLRMSRLKSTHMADSLMPYLPPPPTYILFRYFNAFLLYTFSEFGSRKSRLTGELSQIISTHRKKSILIATAHLIVRSILRLVNSFIYIDTAVCFALLRTNTANHEDVDLRRTVKWITYTIRFLTFIVLNTKILKRLLKNGQREARK